ncbi:MAG TPA: methyltransferase domain-containing protein [Polyangiaceae bacterium]|nr:methyltransferase domain-containing protein [Polyangiaceae bacterium]
MKISDPDEVRALYDGTAESYSTMMDSEIDLPMYADVLGRLSERVAGATGPLVDTACGSGHMLARYRERYEPARQLIGIDLSPKMVAIAKARLGSQAQVHLADMRELPSFVQASSAVAVLNFFALHHLEGTQLAAALREWHRVLQPGGQLVVATWEGRGAIDYGGESDIVAIRYSRDELAASAAAAGFAITRCVVEPVAEMPMDAVYLEAVALQPSG